MALPSDQLKEMRIALPPVTRPVGAYVPGLIEGKLLFLSGQIPLRDGAVAITGRVGPPNGRSLEEAQEAARICALNALAIAGDAAGGINNITRVLKVVVYVASNPGFTDQHKVANGASELLAQVFGENGKHARAAVGVAELPLNASVEVDVTFVLR
jgi:enamine deaminase RidA (YjgF/YER057c/UK114 family)